MRFDFVRAEDANLISTQSEVLRNPPWTALAKAGNLRQFGSFQFEIGPEEILCATLLVKLCSTFSRGRSNSPVSENARRTQCDHKAMGGEGDLTLLLQAHRDEVERQTPAEEK